MCVLCRIDTDRTTEKHCSFSGEYVDFVPNDVVYDAGPFYLLVIILNIMSFALIPDPTKNTVQQHHDVSDR